MTMIELTGFRFDEYDGTGFFSLSSKPSFIWRKFMLEYVKINYSDLPSSWAHYDSRWKNSSVSDNINFEDGDERDPCFLLVKDMPGDKEGRKFIDVLVEAAAHAGSDEDCRRVEEDMNDYVVKIGRRFEQWFESTPGTVRDDVLGRSKEYDDAFIAALNEARTKSGPVKFECVLDFTDLMDDSDRTLPPQGNILQEFRE